MKNLFKISYIIVIIFLILSIFIRHNTVIATTELDGEVQGLFSFFGPKLEVRMKKSNVTFIIPIRSSECIINHPERILGKSVKFKQILKKSGDEEYELVDDIVKKFCIQK